MHHALLRVGRRHLAWAGTALLLSTSNALADVSAGFTALGVPVATGVLDGIRGGFRSADGRLSISFGLQQSVYVDGTLIARGRLDGAGGEPLRVSIGDGNQLQLDASGAAAIVQNSSSGRDIRVLREIDVSVDSLQRVRAAETQRSLVGAVVGSLRR